MKWYENNTFNLYWNLFIYIIYIRSHTYIHSYFWNLKKIRRGKQIHLIYMYNMCILSIKEIINKFSYVKVKLGWQDDSASKDICHQPSTPELYPWNPIPQVVFLLLCVHTHTDRRAHTWAHDKHSVIVNLCIKMY